MVVNTLSIFNPHYDIVLQSKSPGSSISSSSSTSSFCGASFSGATRSPSVRSPSPFQLPTTVKPTSFNMSHSSGKLDSAVGGMSQPQSG